MVRKVEAFDVKTRVLRHTTTFIYISQQDRWRTDEAWWAVFMVLRMAIAKLIFWASNLSRFCIIVQIMCARCSFDSVYPSPKKSIFQKCKF